MFNLRPVELGFLDTAAVATSSPWNSPLRRLKWPHRVELLDRVHEHG